MQLELAPQQNMQKCCRRAFLYALITAALIFVPIMIWDKGYFFFFGDFNVQQIPFYKLAHEAVRSGDIFWNWQTDLGVNFIGSYSFYLIGSPFFWLTLPFPTEFVPHLMAPLLILKHACAAFTGTLYIKRFVRDGNYAVIGGLLYAFSGYAIYNVFFNHFHEAIVFFPLLLVGLEELMVNRRRGVFALAVAANAFVNYWFFIGEVVFVLFYFAVRFSSPEWQTNLRKFLTVVFESVVGVLLAMCLLLPSAMALMGNPRTGTSELLSGWNLWLYWHNQLYPAIAGSAFFPPDLPSRPNLFPDRGAKWASLSAWLPLVSMSGVLAYLRVKRDWLRNLLLISIACAFVPVLNSLFVLLNNSYYARWFYMPVLMMALASVRALETPAIPLKNGFYWTAGITMSTVCILALTPMEQDGRMLLGLTKYPPMFAAVAAIALVSLGIFWLTLRRRGDEKRFTRVVSLCLCGVSVVYSIAFIGMGKAHSDDTEFIRETALKGRYELELDDSKFSRADIYDGMDNLGMFWHIPNIQAFHSIIPVSIMDFYPKVGVKRDVSSKPETKYYQLRSLLSVRWLFVDQEEAEQDLMPGYRLDSNQLGYNIYENDYCIPMGFTYDYYITVRDFEKIDKERRAAVLLRTLVLKDDAAREHGDLLEYMPDTSYNNLGELDYYTDCENRIETAAQSFEIDNRGFTAKINLPRDNLVFFSVPYDKGWTATVNGRAATVEKVNIGFMAVRAPAGENVEIRFNYTTPGLYFGIAVSLFAAFVLAAYLLLCRRRDQGDPIGLTGGYDLDYAAQTGYPEVQPDELPACDILDDAAKDQVQDVSEPSVPDETDDELSELERKAFDQDAKEEPDETN